MLFDKKRTVNIIGIDPGTEFLGLCLLYFDVVTLEIVSVDARTYVGSKLMYYSQVVEAYHGERRARLMAHYANLLDIFEIERPIAVTCEAPFFNPRRPSAFSPLVETMVMVKEALIGYDESKQLLMIEPSVVKRAVGAKGNAPKDDVRAAILALPSMPFVGTKLTDLSEHALDAFAVAYGRYKSYRPYAP